ncbi:expressed unknown protein [Seminavis robusta]|uniref:Uncharacterized protein n=1 Tax=Seminavis robusta TaxID=568900 RepID=A0A9N8HN34_9STRA|nr:expressed unknown protein [Seminavis robusta]|eukprot:Sro792_g203120.1 n/a (310) ;mRNA; f:25585-26514
MEVETVTPSAADEPDSSEGKEHLEETLSDDERLPVPDGVKVETVTPSAAAEDEPDSSNGKEPPEKTLSEEEKLLDDLKQVNEGFCQLFGLDQQETNFTWEHFFVAHCGILKEDALEYERHLIAHRLSPEDTLLESLGILVEYGRIPVGDKLKISKTMQRQEDSFRAQEEQAKKNTKVLGLEKYTEFQARQIISLGGGTSKYEIEWGIEQFEDGMLELEKLVAEAMMKNPEAREGFMAGASMGRKERDPAMKLLRSFGYKTFDYTKGKSVTQPTAQTQPVSANPLLEDLLFGTAKSEEDDRRAARLEMYA